MARDLDAEQRGLLAFLERLVAARSTNPPGDERTVAAEIRAESDTLGLPTPAEFAAAPERPNLVLDVGSGSPTLLVVGHMDTVPDGGSGLWSSDPYRLERRGDSVFGLGVADMKGGLAAMLYTGARIHRLRPGIGTVRFVFAADEEFGSTYGLQWLVDEALISGDAAVLMEPASMAPEPWERLFVAQRGSCQSWLVAHGEPGHSAAAVAWEDRALQSLLRAVDAIVSADLLTGWRHEVDGSGVTVNLGTVISGGTIASIYPSSIAAAIEVRVIEGMDEDLVIEAFETVLRDAGLDDRVTIERASTPLNWIDPGQTMDDERLLSAATGAWVDVFKESPSLGVFPAGTDSLHLNRAGIPAIPAFGPGTLAVAHQPDESLSIKCLLQSVDLLEGLIRRYLSANPTGKEQAGDRRPTRSSHGS